MNKKYFLALILFSSLFIIPGYSSAAGNASINFSPQSGSFKPGQQFQVYVSINPGDSKVDTARVKINFSADSLEIKNFSLDKSFSYQAGANGFDNATGTFSWGAGVPGGISQPQNFGIITFLAKNSGTAQISLQNDSSALSAGENKFGGTSSLAEFAINNAKPVVADPVAKEISKTKPEPKNLLPAQTVETSIESNFKEENSAKTFTTLPFRTMFLFLLGAGIVLALIFTLFIKNLI